MTRKFRPERSSRLAEDIVGHSVQVEHRPRRAGDQLRTHADIGKAKAHLDYTPHVDPQEGLRRTIEWFKTRAVDEAIS